MPHPARVSPLRTCLLVTSVLTGAAQAQDSTARLDEISVEGTTRSGADRLGGGAATNRDGSATSGGGGGPSGVVGYTAKASPVATKTNTALIETPQSVSVVTREQLDDRNVQSLTEALAYTPGAATNVFGFDPRYDAIYVRGFDTTYNGIFRDGLRQSAVGLSLPRNEPYGAEAITILRGPASGLYGLGSPGGILDITSKRPLFVPFGEVQFQAGNFDRYQGNFDIGGPVEGSDGTLAYRLTGVVRQSDTFLPGARDDRAVIAPAFTWTPDADTTFTLLTEYQRTALPGTSFFFNFPGFRVSRLYSGDPGFNDYAGETYRVGYAFEHRFGPDLILRQNMRFQGIDVDYTFTSIDSIVGNTATRSGGLFIEHLRSVAVDTQLEGHVLTGPVAHVLVGGVDYVHFDWTRRFGFPTVPDLDLTGVTDFSRFRYRTVIPRPALDFGATQSLDQVGLYVQEQARFDRFVLTLTGRQDFVSQATTSFSPAGPGRPQSQDLSARTGRVGLNYLLADGLVPYASYATTFTPQVGADAQGRAFPAATGDQIEAGVKIAVPSTNITAAFAGFDIRQSSILRQDPGNVANQVATGEVGSKGFEAELVANFAPGTNLTLSYTHLDFRFVSQSDFSGNILDGNALSGIPGDTFAAFGTYLFPPSSPLAGLTLGGGVRYAANSFADDLNTARNPTVALFDAIVAYDFAALDPRYKGVRAQINAFNVFDRDYTNCQAGFCYRGAPATVIGSLIVRW